MNRENETYANQGSFAGTVVNLISAADGANLPHSDKVAFSFELTGSLLTQGSDGSVTARDFAEMGAELSLSGVIGSVVAGASRGALGGPGAAAFGALSGLFVGPLGQFLGGAAYDALYGWNAQPIGTFFPIGTVASARLPEQYGLVRAGYEMNALDVFSETAFRRSEYTLQDRADGGSHLVESTPASERT